VLLCENIVLLCSHLLSRTRVTLPSWSPKEGPRGLSPKPCSDNCCRGCNFVYRGEVRRRKRWVIRPLKAPEQVFREVSAVTEIPEHLLNRSKARRAAASGESTGDASPAVAASATPAAAAPAKKNVAPAPKAAVPDPVYVAAAKNRRKIPFWAMSALALLPLWALVYLIAVSPSEKKLLRVQQLSVLLCTPAVQAAMVQRRRWRRPGAVPGQCTQDIPSHRGHVELRLHR
jgi:hypothetical protein